MGRFLVLEVAQLDGSLSPSVGLIRDTGQGASSTFISPRYHHGKAGRGRSVVTFWCPWGKAFFVNVVISP